MPTKKEVKPKADQARRREDVLAQLHDFMGADLKDEREARQKLSRELRRTMTMCRALASLLGLAARSGIPLDPADLTGCAELMDRTAATAADALKAEGN